MESLSISKLPREDIFIGDLDAAQCESFMRENGIRSICALQDDFEFYDEHKNINYKLVALADSSNASIDFSEILAFLDTAEKPLLVHCDFGVSRSPTICVAYLMHKNGWSVQKALSAVRSVRACARPNDNFLEQLSFFETANTYKHQGCWGLVMHLFNKILN